MKITSTLTNHPDTGDPKDLPLVTKVDVRDDSVCVRVETEDRRGLCEHYIECRDNKIVLHVWDETHVDNDPSHEPIVLVEDVSLAIENAHDREIGHRPPAVMQRWDYVNIDARSWRVVDASCGSLSPNRPDRPGVIFAGEIANYDLSAALCAFRGSPKIWNADGARRTEMCDGCNDWIIVADDHEPGTGTTCNNCKQHGPGKDGSL